MARRYEGNMNGERYLGNINTMEVHDLDKEGKLMLLSNLNDTVVRRATKLIFLI